MGAPYDVGSPDPLPCRWCGGRGSISVDGGSLRYRCPDCDGTGREPLPTDSDSDSDSSSETATETED